MFDPGHPKNEKDDNNPNIEKERHDNELVRDHEREEKHDAKENFKEHCNDCD